MTKKWASKKMSIFAFFALFSQTFGGSYFCHFWLWGQKIFFVKLHAQNKNQKKYHDLILNTYKKIGNL